MPLKGTYLVIGLISSGLILGVDLKIRAMLCIQSLRQTLDTDL